VGAIPLLILPQILFSEFTVPSGTFEGVVKVIEHGMPVHWSYEVFAQAAAAEPAWGQAILALAVLALYAAVLTALTALALVRRREF